MDGDIAKRSASLNAHLDTCLKGGIAPDFGCRVALERWVASDSVVPPLSPATMPESSEEGARPLRIVKAVLRSAMAIAITVPDALIDTLMDWAWFEREEARDA